MKKGFTLVELAIVVIIIGLLVAGTLAGQELIKQAKFKAVHNEAQNYIRAYHIFNLKYNGLPGDLINAYNFWGNDCGTNAFDINGCNGNGDGSIDGGSISIFTASEHLKIWEHLSLSEMIVGEYDGTGEVESIHHVRIDSSNIPKSSFGNNYWNLSNNPCEACGWGSPNYSAGDNTRNLLNLGSLQTETDGNWLYPVNDLITLDALQFDIKYDDGKSYTGMIRGGNAAEGCGDGNSGDPTDFYDIQLNGINSVKKCNITFVIP